VVDTICDQIVSGVQWSKSIEFLIDLGEESSDDMVFEEIGHGQVLTKLVSAIKKDRGEKVVEPSRSEKTTVEKTKITIENEERKVSPATVKGPSNHDDEARPTVFVVAEEKVKNWNAKYQIGTKVSSTYTDYDDLETRTEAVVLFGHRAAVYMKGYNGYFDLDEIKAL